MKKIVYGIAAVIFLILLLASTANASLVLSVTVQNPTLNPLQSQTIIAETNERGFGVVFVVQPTQASAPWTDILNSNPLPPSLYGLKPLWTSIEMQLQNQQLQNPLQPDKLAEIMNAMGGKIISFNLTSTAKTDGWHFSLVFPRDFTGINGVPSTAAPGTYKVIFVFKSEDIVDAGIVDFACGNWLVIPQVPLGTIMALLSSLCAIPAFKLYRRKHPL